MNYTFLQQFKFCSVFSIIMCFGIIGCSSGSDEDEPFIEEEIGDVIEDELEELEKEAPEQVFANIDFKNWKLTLPVDENNNGSPDEYQPSKLIDFGYQTNENIKPFMYDDESDESIVFYTYPESSTTNSSYSRTELRELINPDNARENWTLKEGGRIKGKLKVQSVSKDTENSNVYHKVIVMQIHGIISIEDMEKHGFSSNNGPPLLKMYWKDGNLWAHKKSLKDESTSGDDLLETSSATWTDVKHNFGRVGYEAFELEIIASDAKLEVVLNNENSHVFQDISLDKWPYENYFKAGNYLGSTSPFAKSYIKYYELQITH